MAKKTHKAVTVGFIALGCPKNVVDSERMLAEIAEAGMLIAAEPERADVVIVNTCGFIEPAIAESLEAVEEALDELPENQREVFLLQAVEGRTFREIALMTGTSINTLLARKRYAVKFLKKRLADIKELLEELS